MGNKEKVLFNKLKYEGKIFDSNNSGKLVVTEYRNSKNVIVEFLQTGYVTKCDLDKILQGKLKDKLAPSVYGVGVVGVQSIRSDGKIVREYSVWSNMLKRCYDKCTLKIQPSYEGCNVSNNFTYFELFKVWYDEQVGSDSVDSYGKSFCLDKDILVKGNKIYSEETCCFVPQEINSLILNHAAGRGDYQIGVSEHKANGKYVSNINIYGKNLYLGSYKTPEEAFNVYKREKERYIKEVAKKWKGKIDEKVYEALINWEVGASG